MILKLNKPEADPLEEIVLAALARPATGPKARAWLDRLRLEGDRSPAASLPAASGEERVAA